MVSVCRGLLQGRVWDVHLLTGIDVWLEKVGHVEDLQDTERRGKAGNGAEETGSVSR